MSVDNIKLIIAAVASVIGVISVLLVWIYALEAKKGVAVLDYYSYKRFVNVTYTFFVLMSAVVWFSTTAADMLLVWAYLGSTVLWLISGVAIFIISVFVNNTDSKKKMRSTLISCLIKTFISALILLFIA